MVAPRFIVLVEGHSDRIALQTLARRLGRDLSSDGVEIVAMDGVTNIRAFAARYGPPGLACRCAVSTTSRRWTTSDGDSRPPA